MRNAATTLVILALSAGFAACGDDEAEPAPDPGAGAIAYSKTGGIAGISVRIEVEPGGRATVRSAHPRESVERFTLTPGELSDLDAAFARAAFDEVDSPGLGAGCADCFTYELTRGDHTIVADDTNFPEELRPVATELDELIGDHTGQAAGG